MTFNTGIENISPEDKISVMTSISMPPTTKQEDKSSSGIEAQAPPGPGAPPSESPQPPDQPPHTILTEKEKIFTIIMASFAAFISPVSASIYYPALNELAQDLHVTVSTINLTITVYMVFQALAPTFIGSISDKNGRRPAYLIRFIIYLSANIGLALQDSYPALVVLRCLQSSGSSGTVALGSAVVADIVTRAERGKYIGYASMGVTLGPALGPIIGGLLSEFLGWRSIFWFLTIFVGSMMFIMFLFFPETSRSVVGNGSVPPQKWNASLMDIIRRRRRQQNGDISLQTNTIAHRKRRPNPLEAVQIAFQKEAGTILFFGALLYAGFFSVLSTLPSQLKAKYDFNSLQIGLCYIPYGIGSLTSRWTVGTLIDWNFRRHARLLGIEIIKNRQQRLADFPIEVARLQITLPLIYMGSVFIIIYGWVMDKRTNLTGPVVTLFFTGHTVTGAFNSLNTLVVDCNIESPATAVAANNLFRCLFGAGAVAAAVPLIERIGMGWTCTFVAGIWLVFSPLLWAVYKWGYGWREKKRLKEGETAEEKVDKIGGSNERDEFRVGDRPGKGLRKSHESECRNSNGITTKLT